MRRRRRGKRQTGGATTGGEATGEAIKIGIFSNNEGAFAPFEGQTWGGAMLPLIDRGATPVSGDPTEGVNGAVIAGHPIEIVYGGSDSTPDKAIEEARRLVEQENVDILVGPLSGSEGIAVANYSKEQPGVTFVNGISGAQDTTLKSAPRTSSAFTTTARSGPRDSAITHTTSSGGATSSRSATTTTSRTRKSPASWRSSARSAETHEEAVAAAR